jgi:hypothetical protein
MTGCAGHMIDHFRRRANACVRHLVVSGPPASDSGLKHFNYEPRTKDNG